CGPAAILGGAAGAILGGALAITREVPHHWRRGRATITTIKSQRIYEYTAHAPARVRLRSRRSLLAALALHESRSAERIDSAACDWLSSNGRSVFPCALAAAV